jgi:hypothetical protein
MAKKLYTAEEIKVKFKGKFIETAPVYNYDKKQWFYEVRQASKLIRENCNPPEEEVVWERPTT